MSYDDPLGYSVSRSVCISMFCFYFFQSLSCANVLTLCGSIINPFAVIKCFKRSSSLRVGCSVHRLLSSSGKPYLPCSDIAEGFCVSRRRFNLYPPHRAKTLYLSHLFAGPFIFWKSSSNIHAISALQFLVLILHFYLWLIFGDLILMQFSCEQWINLRLKSSVIWPPYKHHVQYVPTKYGVKTHRLDS